MASLLRDNEEEENSARDWRRRNRAVADREASRLARPEQRPKTKRLGHASRAKSAVISTPSGLIRKEQASSAASPEEEWCGPFSVARQMIAAREEARRKREAEQLEEEEKREKHPLDDLVAEAEFEKKRKAHPSILWKGNRETMVNKGANVYTVRKRRMMAGRRWKNQKNIVPSLYQLSFDFIINNFEHVEALGLAVDSSIRRDIVQALVADGKMNGAAFETIAEAGVEALEIVDCVEISQEQMSVALKSLVPAGLGALLLRHAGKCFGPKVVKTIVSCSPTANLFSLSIGGAYLLTDSDAANLVSSLASTLTSIDFNACPLVGKDFCSAISENYASSTKGTCLMELSLEDMTVSKESFMALGSSDALRSLKNLTLRQMPTIDDEVVQCLLNATGDCLEGIDLSHNPCLTDACLSNIRKANSGGTLRSLQLGGLRELTAIGLETFFTHHIAGLPSPPMLRKLDLSFCDAEAVNDEVMKLAAMASSMKRTEADGTNSSAVPGGEALSTLGGLVHLNIQGSFQCTDTCLEILAATCASSLKELDVSFCPQISNKGLGYLVAKAQRQLSKIHVWGCAQITDEFLDGHGRVAEGDLEIIGAWMRKAGALSLR